MPMKDQTFAVETEDLCGGFVKCSAANKLFNGISCLKSRIDAEEGIRPEPVTGIEAFDLFLNVFRSDLREGSGKSLVVPHEHTIEIENIHDSSPP
jgi:hypothetical protein